MTTNLTTSTIYPLIQQTLQLPIYLYKEESLLNCYPSQSTHTHPPKKLVTKIKMQLKSTDVPYIIYSTDFHIWYAGISLLNENDTILLLGPINSVAYNENTFLRMYMYYDVNDEGKNVFRSFVQNIPCMDYYHLSQKIQLINYICNNMSQQTSSVAVNKDSVMNQSEHPPIAVISDESHLNFTRNIESSYSLHNENVLLSHIRYGDVNALKEFMCNLPDYKNGKMADNNLRQEKNSCIITISLACRAAIEGGLPEDTAFMISDYYIQQMERINDIKQLILLLKEVLINYTSRVESQSLPLSDDYLIQKCIQYVRENVNLKITTQDVADYVGYSRSYVSTKFKNDMGFDLSSFIIRCKLEKSKMMLKSTDYTINEISHSLSFSNQSHYHLHFKRKYKMTPSEYRNTK